MSDYTDTFDISTTSSRADDLDIPVFLLRGVGGMEFHPLANLFPLLDGKEFNELVIDIRENGLVSPVVLYEGKVLDGRNRYRACLAAGVEPRLIPFEGNDPVAFVVSANIKRRHLGESQRGMIAARIETMKHGGDPQVGSRCKFAS
jgi:hypothetical protein